MKSARRISLAIIAFAAIRTNAQKVANVRDIDFDNFTYAWSEDVPIDWKWHRPTQDEHFRMIDGIHHFHFPEQDSFELQHAPLISVDSVTYGDLDGDGIEEAVVALNYSAGSTANWDYLYVYKLQQGRAKLIARIRTGSRANAGLVRAFVRQHVVVVDFADSEMRVGDCCSEGFVRVSYRWQDGDFVEEGEREHGKIHLEESPPRPKFRSFRVKSIYRGEPAKPIITNEFHDFRTRIRIGAKSEVEFAGHYTIPRWGCGTDCNGFAIVDSITGKVYNGFGIAALSFDWINEHGGDDAIPRMEFYPGSRLLKINACPNEVDCGFYDYEMIEGKGLKLLRVELLPSESQTPQSP